MTISETKKYLEGSDYWQYYVKINGYAFNPTESGLKKISRLLDINLKHLRKCINLYLES
jgi:hypothetical protein